MSGPEPEGSASPDDHAPAPTTVPQAVDFQSPEYEEEEEVNSLSFVPDRFGHEFLTCMRLKVSGEIQHIRIGDFVTLRGLSVDGFLR